MNAYETWRVIVHAWGCAYVRAAIVVVVNVVVDVMSVTVVLVMVLCSIAGAMLWARSVRVCARVQCGYAAHVS